MIDHLIKLVRSGFEQIPDHRRNNNSYALSDLLSIGYAMFALKDPSLSSFRGQYEVRAQNLRQVYGITGLPGDTALREGLDGVAPQDIKEVFKLPLNVLRREGVLEQRQVLGGYTAMSIDGTGHYCSGKRSCPQCMVKQHRNGKKTYYHQLLGAVLVCPGQSSVFPVACEAIVKQDGSTKNDCELNACKRLLPQVSSLLPEEKILGIFDALYCNGPHIKALKEEQMSYIIGTKGETYVDVQVERLKKAGKLEELEWQHDGTSCSARWINGLILNGQHQDIRTNYFEYQEVDTATGEQLFYSTWITDLEIAAHNIKELVKVARSRWKIENETFNTLKNQGYHLEHNYGHGEKYLATNFAILTFLAFLVDQIAQHLDKNFQAAKEVCQSFKALWERTRFVFYLVPTMSMDAIYRFIVKRKQIDMPALE